MVAYQVILDQSEFCRHFLLKNVTTPRIYHLIFPVEYPSEDSIDKILWLFVLRNNLYHQSLELSCVKFLLWNDFTVKVFNRLDRGASCGPFWATRATAMGRWLFERWRKLRSLDRRTYDVAIVRGWASTVRHAVKLADGNFLQICLHVYFAVEFRAGRGCWNVDNFFDTTLLDLVNYRWISLI